MPTKPKVPVAQSPQGGRRRGFTIRELAVSLACLLVAAGLLASLAGANRDLSKASVCASNLETMFGGLMAYVNTYNSFPPHNPYPGYTTETASKNGIDSGGFDPNIGWIMTYGLAMAPPESHTNGHFKWFVLDQYHLPSVCVCPAANYDLLFTPNPEIDANNLESFVFRYAVFYQTSGTCRSGTPVVGTFGQQTLGGTNPVVPVPSPIFPSMGPPARPCRNACPASPPAYVWVDAKGSGRPDDPWDTAGEANCWIQAVHPSQVQDPGRVYYLADSRDYRPDAIPDSWPSAGINDGWYNGWGNYIYMGTRHYGYANVMYLDGQVNRDNLAHPRLEWNMDYDHATYTARSSQWRCSTFADRIDMARIGTQHHIMPQLNIVGWERFFNSDGVATR